MNLIRPLCLIALTLPMACSKSGGDAAPVSSASAPVVRSSADRRPDRPRVRSAEGMVGMLLGETHELTLKDEQKAALDKIEQRLRSDDKGPLPEVKELQSTMVAGVKAGKLDMAKIAQIKADIDKAMQARRDKDAEALNGLYAALEPAQRKSLATALRTKQAEREARIAARKADAPKPDATEWKKHKLEQMTKDLDLDAAQQKKVEALLAKDSSQAPASLDEAQNEMKKRLDALLTAFEGDSFDAKKLEVPAMAGKMTEMMDQQAQFLSLVLPILKPEQREKMAANMDKQTVRRGPGGGPMGPPMGGPPGHPRMDPGNGPPSGPGPAGPAR
ncbi:MAG: Spy/CpxP family protein refolding chaperone [Deltaproteobacteria bacterium]|nr:Spy/CpxP family protein refolding chaperone [Deltaproteobacteria bacterium]